MWELPIGGGYFFAMLMLFCVWRALHAEHRRTGTEAETTRRRESDAVGPRGPAAVKSNTRGWWFAGAGLCLGLAIASRPIYLIASPLLGVPLLWWWQKERRLPWRLALSVALPLAIVGGAMAWHNYARFEDPLQFGQRYQFSLDYESKLPHFRAAYIPYNVRANFLSGAEWSRYFPFIRRPDVGVPPEGFTTHRGDVYGIMIDFPIAWLALLAPLALWRRPRDERGPLGAWIGTVAVLFVLCAAVLLSFFSVLARYQMDFVPALMLLACVGLLSLERFLTTAATPSWRSAARVGWVSAAMFSAVFGIIFSLQFDGLLLERNPVLEHKVARTLNHVPATLERLLGVRHGSVELEMRLPSRRRPGRETLLTSGELPRLDRVFVHYRDDGRVQFGVVQSGGPEQLTRPLIIDPQSSHRLNVTMASLYPPLWHPFFAAKKPEEIRSVTREVRIEFDGEPVLVEQRRSPATISAVVRVGDKAAVDATYPRFRGTILSSYRLDETVGAGAAATAFVRLRLAFNRAAVGAEPLVAFGAGNPGVLVTATRVGERQIKFAVAAGGVELSESDPVETTFERGHEIVVRVEKVAELSRRRVYLWLDGELVFARAVGWAAGVLPDITAGKNEWGFANCATAFTGEIFSVQPGSRGVDALVGKGDTLRMRVRLPANRHGSREPLIVTGRNGAGDMLMIEYVDAQTVLFALDHWGAPMQVSKPWRIDFAQSHDFEISMPSLATFDDATLVREARWGRLRLLVDGALAWEQEANFYSTEPGEITVGRNPIGGTSAGPIFTGDVLSAERIVRE
jgi:hypothetical protein